MRKYAVTEKLSELVADLVEAELDHVFESSDELQYEIVEYVEGIVNNILAVSSFGEA